MAVRGHVRDGGALFLYAASGLVAPGWAVAVLLLLWCATVVVGARRWTPHASSCSALVVVWFLALVAGARRLVWSA